MEGRFNQADLRKTYKLTDCKDKQAVMLVFVYGDT